MTYRARQKASAGSNHVAWVHQHVDDSNVDCQDHLALRHEGGGGAAAGVGAGARAHWPRLRVDRDPVRDRGEQGRGGAHQAAVPRGDAGWVPGDRVPGDRVPGERVLEY